jgi:branched-subunit amino acid transport protein
VSALLTVLAAAAVSYALRAAVPLGAGRRAVPHRAVAAIRLAPPAVLAALLAGSLAAEPTAALAPRLVVVGIGVAVALRTRSVPLTLGAGLGAHLLLTHLPIGALT